MAVAVKNTPETRTPSLFDRLSAVSLAGVVYVLGTVGIVFKGLPALWEQLGLPSDSFMGVALEGAALLAVLVVLLVVGVRLMGPTARPGLRAGIFTGLVLLLVLTLVGRWLGGILEGWVYDGGWFPGNEAMVGGILAGVIVGLLALWVLRIFFRRGFENWLVRFEEQGWFSGKAFKPGQGLRVRRGTILGILLLAGSGIWVLVNRGTLGSGGWEINIPFTGQFVVEDIGDAGSALESTPPQQYRVVDPGWAEGLEEGTTLSFDRATELDEKVLGPLAATKKKELDGLIADLLTQALDKARVQKSSVKTLADLQKALNAPRESTERVTDPEVARLVGRIEELKRFEPLLGEKTGLKRFGAQREIDRYVLAEQEREKERKKVSKESTAGTASSSAVELVVRWTDRNRLPILAPVLERFRVRDINKDLDPLSFRIVRDTPLQFPTGAGDESWIWFKPGEIVNQRDFEDKVEAIKKELTARGERGVDVEDLAKKAAPPTKPMEGHVVYASITLLPAVRFTIPLLLLLLTIWLAWRVVNLPTFGDFLIATEAELNKVSWTTRARLWQDSLVVLTTMLLMALFLFVVDIAWGKILSWNPIGVLQVKTQTEKPKDEANLKW
ncbi:MAG: preprotein translocase subunit SecE [Planctomycetes bacterium]|nr:preprotein translocase subunit SecE [Planctomycetota bacterium]